MIRTKGEAGTGDVIEAVRHTRLITTAIQDLQFRDEDAVRGIANIYADTYATLLREVRASQGLPAAVADKDIVFGEYTLDDIAEGLFELLQEVRTMQRLPVVNFAAGGIATPADAAMMMLLGCDGVFVGSGIFKSENPEVRARAIVEASTHFDDPAVVAEVSKNLGVSMKGIHVASISAEARLQERGR